MSLFAESQRTIFMAATSFPASRQDWKSIFIRHLAESIGRRREFDLALWAPPGECAPTVRWQLTPPDAAMLTALMEQGGVAHLLRNRPLAGMLAAGRMLWALRRAARSSVCRLYHCLWLQTALSLPADGRPLVISALGSDLALLKWPLVRKLLRRVMRQHTSVICPNADWMVDPLAHAFGDLAKIEPVAFGIDPDWYNITRKPNTPHRWIAVTRITRSKLGDLLDWCAPHFQERSRELHVFGPAQEPISLPDWVFAHGPASPEELRSHCFADATGLITLSRHAEGKPQVMLEAMAAGLPVIASDLPAHRDLINDETSGLICRSSSQLGELLARAEHPETNARLGASARASVKEQVGTWDDCAARYALVYHELLRRRG